MNQSPVGERIEHFTEGMTADGAGSLDLTLVMPLQHVADTTVRASIALPRTRYASRPPRRH